MWKKRDKTGGKTPRPGKRPGATDPARGAHDDALGAKKARYAGSSGTPAGKRPGATGPARGAHDDALGAKKARYAGSSGTPAGKRPWATGPARGAHDDALGAKKARYAGSSGTPAGKLDFSGKTKTRAQWKKDNEFILCGWNACMRAFETRPQEICRLYFSKERSLQINAVKYWCRDHKLPYRELDDESLNKAAGSVHHEGVVLVIRPPRTGSLQALTLRGLPPEGILVALDRVENVHNVGAILRTCAFFGAVGLLVGMEKEPLAVSPSLARVAEGALETVPIYQSADLPSSLRDLHAARTFVLGADLTADRSIYDIEVPFPCVVALGNEQEGLSERVKKRCDAVVSVPGSGTMQSLNVSVAAGVVLAELRRRRASMGKPARPGALSITP